MCERSYISASVYGHTSVPFTFGECPTCEMRLHSSSSSGAPLHEESVAFPCFPGLQWLAGRCSCDRHAWDWDRHPKHSSDHTHHILMSRQGWKSESIFLKNSYGEKCSHLIRVNIMQVVGGWWRLQVSGCSLEPAPQSKSGIHLHCRCLKNILFDKAYH